MKTVFERAAERQAARESGEPVIERTILKAMKDPDNLNDDGSIIWDFVSADAHIIHGVQFSDTIEKVITRIADELESK